MIFILFNIILDLLLINLGFVISFFLRFQGYHPSFQIYKEIFLIISVIFLFSFFISKVYKRRFVSIWKVFEKVFLGVFLSTFFYAFLLYVFRAKWGGFPSSILPISFLVNFVLVSIIKSVVYQYKGKIKKNTVFVEKQDITDFIKGKKLNDIDEIVLADEILDAKDLYSLIGICQSFGIKLSIAPEYYENYLTKKVNGSLSNNIHVSFYSNKVKPIENFLISAFDIFIALFVFILALPILIAVSFLIKIDSSGPVIYKQKRVGINGNIFMLYKFRTMFRDAEKETGPVWASAYDKRITKIGEFLRKTRLDELPQLFNVLKGDMSLVGPRPERPHFVKEHKALRSVRLSIKPGLTGLAQVRNYYDLKPKYKLKYDYLYIQKRSFLLNLYVLLKTLPVVFGRKGT